MAIERAYVIGMGEVGRRIAGALAATGTEIVPVTRAAGWDDALSTRRGPRIVCVGEPQLADAVERLQRVDPASLVFVQNGWIRPELAGLESATRGLIWFTSKGDFFTELRPSPFSGPLAGELATALGLGGLAAEALDDQAFRGAEAEKMGFNCVVGLPLAVHGVTLGDYLSQCPGEARAVFDEAVAVCARALGVVPDPEWWTAFLRAAEPLAWVASRAPKALAWRNGAVVALARELGLLAPVNAGLIASAGAA
jgi:ketopantoate reductase